MILTYDQRRLAQQKLESCIHKAQIHFNCHFNMPLLAFNQRGKIAGTAHLQRNLIKLNAVLMADNMDTFLQEVIPHETAHIVVYQKFGRVKPHGIEWQSVMRDAFDSQPEVRHSMDVSKTQGQIFQYKCGCGPVMLSVRRHNKVVRGKQTYMCRNCQQALTAIQN